MCNNIVAKGMISHSKLRNVVDDNEKLARGKKSLPPDEEALPVAYSKKKVVHGISTTQKMLGMILNDMLIGIYSKMSRKEPSLLAYSRH